MRIFLLFAVCLSLSAAEEMSDEESLAVRRIADFWEEGEIQIAKSQIEGFLIQFPDSPYFDTLCAALGDLFLRESSYQIALNYYAQIGEQTVVDRVFLHRMQCLYQLQWQATLADECEAFLKRAESASPQDRLQATYLLTIALSQQCFQAEKSEEERLALAARAKPHFEAIANSEASEEASMAYAHLCCVLKDFERASKVYLDLAARGINPEEMRFQAALLQAKFDKALSSATFATLAQGSSPHAKESVYNQLVLAFEQGNFEDIVQNKDGWLEKVPGERTSFVHLIVGKSLLSLKKYPEAAQEFSAFLALNQSKDALRPAALHLLEAAYHANDLALLELSIHHLQEINPKDAEMSKALLAKAELLMKAGKSLDAAQTLNILITQFGASPERPQALLAQMNIAMSQSDWASCKTKAGAFLKEFPSHVSAWKTLITASSFLGDKEELSRDLEQLLAVCKALSSEEKCEFQFLLGKTSFELGLYEKTLEQLRGLEKPDAALLSAFCYRDGFQDMEAFCKWAEEALAQGATLLSVGEQRMALFNGYLTLGKLPKAAEHLLGAFEAKTEIKKENLLWLANFLYGEFEKRPETASVAYKFLLALSDNSHLVKIAKLEQFLGKTVEAIARLEGSTEKEALLLLGELMMQQGNLARAETLFSQAATGQGRFSAAAALQTARLQMARGQTAEAAVLLKNLVLQKSLENEPFHLEAGLDYVELQGSEITKRLQLLNKLKTDFTAQNDLLAKDYHLARTHFPEKNKIYEQYMLYVDAEILFSEQKELQAKELLLQLKKEPLSLPLEARIQRRLKSL
jgi:TolA-binding protein